MIELKNSTLVFSFPEVHKEAQLGIDFQRTLRIPDDDNSYPLPPGLGSFPLRHVDDYAEKVPARWLQHGGVMLPMYQSEAMWLHFRPNDPFDRQSAYPFAIMVAAGKINAATGDEWNDKLERDPQNYMVAPDQPWLDGFCVEQGFIRQFVAMPLGAGYSAEEQLTGKAEFGGVQIKVFPMKAEEYDRRYPKIDRAARGMMERAAVYSDVACAAPQAEMMEMEEADYDMGLGAGGKMKQEIYDDAYPFEVWDTEHASRCFVHLCNSMVWRAITGQDPPTTPPTSREYTDAGLPWFDYYADGKKAVEGSEKLAGLKTVKEIGKEKGDKPLPENATVTPQSILEMRKKLKKDQVREGRF